MIVKWEEFANRFVIDDNTRKRLKAAYPFFEQELVNMEIWVIANWKTLSGTKGKGQKKRWDRFITNWLMRAQARYQIAPKPVNKYEIYNQELKQKMEQAEKEAAPPPDDWRKLMNKLKPKGSE